MEISKIINKTELTQDEMQFVVEEYIYEIKNKRVQINILNHPVVMQFGINNLISKQILENELMLLHMAFQSASIYFHKKENKKVFS